MKKNCFTKINNKPPCDEDITTDTGTSTIAAPSPAPPEDTLQAPP